MEDRVKKAETKPLNAELRPKEPALVWQPF